MESNDPKSQVCLRLISSDSIHFGSVCPYFIGLKINYFNVCSVLVLHITLLFADAFYFDFCFLMRNVRSIVGVTFVFQRYAWYMYIIHCIAVHHTCTYTRTCTYNENIMGWYFSYAMAVHVHPPVRVIST